jgi:hypothetical protein
MKRFLLILSILVVSGCAHNTPVTMKFPEVPTDMLKACPDLATVDPNTTKLSDVVTTVTNNYQQYYGCKDSVDSWIDWYNTQSKIFNNIK